MVLAVLSEQTNFTKMIHTTLMKEILEESRENEVLDMIKHVHASNSEQQSHYDLYSPESQFLQTCAHTFQDQYVKLSILQYINSIGIQSSIGINRINIGLCLRLHHESQCTCDYTIKWASNGCACRISDVEKWMIETFLVTVDDIADMLPRSTRMGRSDFRNLIFENILMDHDEFVNIDRCLCNDANVTLLLLAHFKNLFVSVNTIRQLHVSCYVTFVDLMFSRWCPSWSFDGYDFLLRDIVVYGGDEPLIPYFEKWFEIPNKNLHEMLFCSIADGNSLSLYQRFKANEPISSIISFTSRLLRSYSSFQGNEPDTKLLEETLYDLRESNIDINKILQNARYEHRSMPENFVLTLLKFGYLFFENINDQGLLKSWNELKLFRQVLESTIMNSGLYQEIANICGEYVFVKALSKDDK